MVSVFEDSLPLKKQLPGTYSFRFLTYFRQHTMMFSIKDKPIIKKDCDEKVWTAYRICKEHKSKEWILSSVQLILKQFKEDGSMKRRTGSGQLITVTANENAESVEELTCLQEDFSGTITVYMKSLEMLVSAEVR